MPEPYMTRRILTAAALLATIQCGGSTSPTSPSNDGAIASVTLNAASLAAGATTQAIVTLAAPAPAAGAAVALSSSNTAVATVPASVAVAAGATSGSFTVTA